MKWLKKVKAETGLKVTTEVANTAHVYEALKHDVDVLWVGARSTVNPFVVQEIADALEGVDKPVMIKNPVNPDLSLWIGAIERMYKAGITRIAAIHRGFSSYGDSKFRNVPRWQIPIELKRQFPNLMIICDNSHICGRRDTLAEVAQQAMDMNFDGIMTETHITPDDAWSDAKQQITPAVFEQLVNNLVLREENTNDATFLGNLDNIRQQIDELDEELLNVLGARMILSQRIGAYKKANNISILQTARWNEILNHSIQEGQKRGLSEDFITKYLHAVHQESISHQVSVMNQTDETAIVGNGKKEQ